MRLRAVLFDLYGTLAHVECPISSEEISKFILEHGYEVYPQALDAASHYVSMIDYPKHGYDSWKAYLKQVFNRLDIKEVDTKTLKELTTIYRKHRSLTLFTDAVPAVRRAKELNLKSAIVTTIAHFSFSHAIEPVKDCLDVITTGYEARCEKSNPEMHKQTLKRLGAIPEEAVMIGDDLLVDVRIPKSLGMRAIFLDRDKGVRHKPPEADAKVTTLIEAMAKIEELI